MAAWGVPVTGWLGYPLQKSANDWSEERAPIYILLNIYLKYARRELRALQARSFGRGALPAQKAGFQVGKLRAWKNCSRRALKVGKIDLNQNIRWSRRETPRLNVLIIG